MLGNTLRSMYRRAIPATALALVLAGCTGGNTEAASLRSDETALSNEEVSPTTPEATAPEVGNLVLPYTVDWTACPDQITAGTRVIFDGEGHWGQVNAQGVDITGMGIMDDAPRFGTGPDAETRGKEHFCSSGD